MNGPTDDALRVVQRRLERERAARRETEAIAERVTREMYSTSVELRVANGELHALNDALREFVAIASHDLRGPLTAILGIASLLNRRWADLDDVRRQESLAAIERQGRALARLVDDLLTVSRIEAGQVDIGAETVPLRSTIETLVDDIVRDAGVRIGGDEVTATVDGDHLRRILGNYLANAVKYGEPPIRVDVRDAGDWAEVVVRDEGDGVPAELVPRLFGTFARGGRSRELGGTGLGLSIVRGLARANGGDAWYEPNDPHGSCFGVRLPKAAG
jgi:signal transduction histidine kinase